MDKVKQAEEILWEASALVKVIERQNVTTSEVIKNCQKAVECYNQAICKLLDVEFALDYEQISSCSQQEIRDKLQNMIKQVHNSHMPTLFPYKEKVPKMVFLFFLWSSYRYFAENVLKGLNVSSGVMFDQEERRVAMEHTKFCHKLVKSLIDLKK